MTTSATEPWVETILSARDSETAWSGIFDRLRDVVLATPNPQTLHKQTVDPDCDTPAGDDVCVTRKDRAVGQPGSTFVFVSGLGGRSSRHQVRSGPIWASIYTGSQGAKDGALFITFNVGGDPNKAQGEFVNIDGEVIDSFTVTATSGGG